MNEEVIRTIWRFGTGDFHWLAAIDRLNNNKFTHWTVDKEDFFLEQPHGHDIFFAPLPTTVAERGNEYVLYPTVLFADADEGARLDKFPKPSALWDTSANNKQAVWLLDKPFRKYDKWAALNKAVTRFIGADSGGWMGSKLLRVPGSVNWKRRDFGKLISFDSGRVYAAGDLAKHIHHVYTPALTSPNGSLWPEPFYSDEWSGYVRDKWDKLSGRSRWALARNTNDRSLHIVRTIHLLKKDGFSSEEVFHLLWGAPFNKWRTDRYDPGRLWQEIEAAQP